MGWLACPFLLTALSFSPFSFPPFSFPTALKPASASPLPEIGPGPGPGLAGWRVLLSPPARSRVGQLLFWQGRSVPDRVDVCYSNAILVNY